MTEELKPCPYVHTSKGGTSHCTLAENEVRRLHRQVEVLRDGLHSMAYDEFAAERFRMDAARKALAAADKIEKE